MPTTTAADAVARVLAVQADYYAVLKIEDKAGLTAERVRAAARAVARDVHPDRATVRGADPEAATSAAAIVNTAASTLADPRRRQIYDAWAAADKPGGRDSAQTFAEWEASLGSFEHLPVFIRRLLTRRGGACLVATLLILLLIPLIAVLLVLSLLCLPVRGALWCCGVDLGGGEDGAPPKQPWWRRRRREGPPPPTTTSGDVEMGRAGPAAPADSYGATVEDSFFEAGGGGDGDRTATPPPPPPPAVIVLGEPPPAAAAEEEVTSPVRGGGGW